MPRGLRSWAFPTAMSPRSWRRRTCFIPVVTCKAGSKKLTVSTDAKFQSVEDVANMLLPLPTGGTVRLGEVANVVLETTDPDTIADMNATSCVLLQVSKQSGANEVATSEAVVERLDELTAENPSVHYAAPYLASDYINLSVESALQNIVLGVVLAAIVVFLFLRRWGATMTIAISMPVCILTVFILMNVFDLTLNMMSLGGIAMGVGMIVDNSIVVLENIYRFASEGHDRFSACVEGTKEVTTSVVASTLTTVAVFLPLGLSGGIAGMMFKDFSLTIAFLILASLIIALTLVPLLCYMLLDENKVRQQAMKKPSGLPIPSGTDRRLDQPAQQPLSAAAAVLRLSSEDRHAGVCCHGGDFLRCAAFPPIWS